MAGTLWWLGASLFQGIFSMALFVCAIWAGSTVGARSGKVWGWITGIAGLAAMILLFDATHDAIFPDRCRGGSHHHHGCTG